jgi:hypothetical protein
LTQKSSPAPNHCNTTSCIYHFDATLSILPEAKISISAPHIKFSFSKALAAENGHLTALVTIDLPSFSHAPTPEIRGSAHWSIPLDAQGFPPKDQPLHSDILIWVSHPLPLSE